MNSQAPELSFEWAKSGSWDQYEQELERVLSVRKSAIGPVTPPAPLVPGTGGGDIPMGGPPAPPPMKPGIMDQVKGFGSDMLGHASDMWNKMPTWGQGALIGGGIGALGGLMTDKKKTRGALQGALLGSGLGALGGYAYNQMNPEPRTPVDISKIAPKPTAEPTGVSGWVDKNVSQPVSEATDWLTGTRGGGLATAIGGTALGQGIYAMGNKNAVPFAGADTSPKAGPTTNRPTQFTRPTEAQALQHLSMDDKAMRSALQQVAMKNAPSPEVGATLKPSPAEVLAARTRLSSPNFKDNPFLISNIGGNPMPTVKGTDLTKAYQAKLQDEAGVKLKSPTVAGIPRNMVNTGLRTLGRGTQLGALGMGGAQALGLTGIPEDPLAEISKLKFGQDTAPIIIKALRSVPSKNAINWIQNADVLPEERSQLMELFR